MDACYKENRVNAIPTHGIAVPSEPTTTIKDTINELGFALREIECRTTSLSRFFEMKKEDDVRPSCEPKDMGEALQQHLELAKKILSIIVEIEARLGM